MKTTTVREVQHNLTRILRWIEDGEVVEVTFVRRNCKSPMRCRIATTSRGSYTQKRTFKVRFFCERPSSRRLDIKSRKKHMASQKIL